MTSATGFSRIPKRGALALATTVLAVLLLFSFKTPEQPALAVLPSTAVVGAPAAATPGPIALGPPPPATSAPGRGHTAAPVQPPSSAAPGLGSGTFTGDAIRTPYGTVQVAVTMAAGRIVDVQGVQMPYDRRLSAQISQEAGPLLRDEVLQAQSANINGVSGASYTSYGYYQSLQSALARVQ